MMMRTRAKSSSSPSSSSSSARKRPKQSSRVRSRGRGRGRNKGDDDDDDGGKAIVPLDDGSATEIEESGSDSNGGGGEETPPRRKRKGDTKAKKTQGKGKRQQRKQRAASGDEETSDEGDVSVDSDDNSSSGEDSTSKRKGRRRSRKSGRKGAKKQAQRKGRRKQDSDDSASEGTDDDGDHGSDDDGRILWQWKCGGRWVAYAPKDIELLEDAFTDDQDELKTTALTFNSKSKMDYVFDFKANTQTNLDTGKIRQIRRMTFPKRKSKSGEDDISYAKLVRMHSAEWTKASPKKKAKGKDSKKKDRATTSAKSSASSSSSSSSSSSGRRKGDKGGPEKKSDFALKDLPPKLSSTEIKYQAALGAQSRRSCRLDYGPFVKKSKHATMCFDKMLENEARLSGEWACFYNSYSCAALLFEVQAAVAAVLFRFKSTYATLPRLLLKPFRYMGDADDLMSKFKLMRGQDHDTRFRAVAICAVTSLLAADSEAPPKTVFLQGYSCTDVSFMGILKSLLISCHVPKPKVNKLAKDIVALSEKYGLDVSQFGGKRCKSAHPGHMLQIFIKRHLVDKFTYAALPFGVIDKKRMPISSAMNGPGPIKGQVRICAHPALFMRAQLTRMFVYSADETFHHNREKFQEELTALLEPIVGSDETREAAATGIFDGSLPEWFDSGDQSAHAKIANKYK